MSQSQALEIFQVRWFRLFKRWNKEKEVEEESLKKQKKIFFNVMSKTRDLYLGMVHIGDKTIEKCNKVIIV
jgi:hypothetical protein